MGFNGIELRFGFSCNRKEGEFIMNLGEDLKKILLAGVGAVAITAEKAGEIVETLVKKGELTVEQGKVLNEELRRNIEDAAKSREEKRNASKMNDIMQEISKMSKEDLAVFKAKLAEMEKADEDEVDKA